MRKATKALIIARVSTEEQAKEDEKFSLQAQLRELRAYFKTGGKFKTLKQLIDVKEIVGRIRVYISSSSNLDVLPTP